MRGWTEAELRELDGRAAGCLSRRLALFPSALIEAGADLRALQPVAGRFEIEGDTLVFVPRFPFLDGRRYALVVDANAPGAAPEVWTIECPVRAEAPATDVVALYPSADAVPVNLLKVYVQFSGPMSEGWAARAVRVRRADDGAPLEGVFLDMQPELWDRQRRRLTLLLDPGRIKRGLVPHREAGYPLVAGVPVTVSVDAAFRDAAGRPLRTGAARRYEVGPPLRARVDPRHWQLDTPAAGATSPLVVSFDRPLDRALLDHSLWVHDAAGVQIEGQASVGPAEQSWRFAPAFPWRAGRYAVLVDPRLEDLAGNSLTRVFDRDLLRAEDTPADRRYMALEFTVSDSP